MSWLRPIRSLFILVLIGVSFSVVQPTQAATFTVNSTGDAQDAAPADGVCATVAGVCTLRAAIQSVNAAPAGLHTITFDETVFASPAIIGMGSTLPAITSQVNIIGTANMTVILSGVGSVRSGFNIGPAGIVEISRLTIRDGRTTDGAAIFNGGRLIARNVDIHNNVATRFGGGIVNTNRLTLIDSTVRGNTGQLGGGIYNQNTMTLVNVTVSGNTGTDAGGGILTNSNTLTTIRQSTIAFNNAVNGGGMDVRDAVSIGSSIIARNTATGIAPDVFGDIDSLGHLLLTNSDGTTITGTTTGNLIDAAAEPVNLAPLAVNGGLTRTHALTIGSVAINAGSNALAIDPDLVALPNDQRGTGFPRIIGGTVDMGAFEAAQFTLHTTLQGRGANPTPHPSYVINAQVRFTRASDNALVHTASLTTSTAASVSFFGLPPDVYRVWVKGSRSLARMSGDVTVNLDANTSYTTAVLLEGDANDNNQVTVADFAVMAASFGLSSGDPGYDVRADFNGSGQITIADFSLLAGNFGQVGDAQ